MACCPLAISGPSPGGSSQAVVTTTRVPSFLHRLPPFSAFPQVDEETYAKMVEMVNNNRIRDGDVDARSVTEALAALGITESAAADTNPEK